MQTVSFSIVLQQ